MTKEIQEPTEPKVEPTEPKPELQDLVSKLDELGITSPEQLENKYKAASEAGRLANIVGELREEVASLKTAPPPAQTEYDESSINIDEAIGNAVTKALDKREQAAKKVQMERMREIHAIRSDGDYRMIGDKFERFMRTPDASVALQNGETPTSIYNKMVRLEYRNMLVQMKDSVANTQGDPSKTVVPHMENSQTAPPRVEPADEKKSKLKSIRETWKGDDADIEKALDVLLPSGTIPM